jgi:peptide/nickel transport system permease protein
MSWVLLWTDALLFAMFASLLLAVWQIRRRPHLLAPWRRVFRSSAAMSASVVLCAYLLVALTDSLHLQRTDPSGRPSGEIVSLFDLFLTPLREQQEKTYSQPLAIHLYSKENIVGEDGVGRREYPRLLWAGQHLRNPEMERGGDIALRVFAGALAGLMAWSLVAVGALLWVTRRDPERRGQCWRRVAGGATALPWRSMWLTLGALFLLFGVVVALAQGYHVLGTDKVGEDVLYQALKSIRTGVVIGTVTTLVMLPAALLLGIMAGYFRGWVDDLIQYLYTTLNSIPGVLLIAAAVLMLQIHMSNHPDDFASLVERADVRLLFLCLILGITSWTGLCRLLRGETLKLREAEYVQAAVALGVGHFVILRRHILPNLMHIVMISVALDFSGLVLAEAVLSYVNIGVDPTMNSWGNMINSARLELAREPVVWWPLLAAFSLMFVLVLAANLFADAVRDAFDPRLKHGAA